MEWEIIEPKNYEVMMQNQGIGAILAKVLCVGVDGLEKDVPLNDFALFKDSERVLARIEKAIMNKEKVAIYGDYDCDGIMATSIMVRAFELRGLQVGYHIPDRFIDGYGLNVSRVEQLAKKDYTLIITVDNGVSADEAVKRANELGIDVIITDHHDLPEKLPDAYAIIHTRLSPNYPFKAICGGFIACKLATAMLKKQDPYIYCLAALSTISDMMPMLNENRTLVKKALKVLEMKKYLSFELLLGQNTKYTATNLGFIIAPKINSIGRLDEGMNPNKAILYFKHEGASSDEERNFKLQFATEASRLNTRRQELTNSQYTIAKKKMIDCQGAYIAIDENFHEGLVGLVAGKITNEYYHPSFIIKKDLETNLYKGSARGISGVNIHDALSFANESLLYFGGHEKAGGFTIKEGKWDLFIKLTTAYFEKNLTGDMLIEKKPCLYLNQRDLSIANVEELSILEPFGQENEEPTFYVKVSDPQMVTTLKDGKHLKLTFSLPNGNVDCLWFNHGSEYENMKSKEDFELFGQLSINEFRNKKTISMIIKDLR